VSGALAAEVGRKAFHMLSLVYLAGFLALGWPLAGMCTAAWLVVCLGIETARLKLPAVRRALEGAFKGLMRDSEREHFSGIVHTTAGCLLAMLVGGGDRVIVTAAILQLAFSDAAAALVGKAWGRTRLLGGKKTLEGSLAAFAAGLACAWAAGVPPGPAAASALVVALVELLPTTGWFNDNLTIPAASASVLRLLLPR
jgi:dolichol kinase